MQRFSGINAIPTDLFTGAVTTQVCSGGQSVHSNIGG